MPLIVFAADAPQYLALFILGATIAAYFLTLRQKTPDLRLMIGCLSCWCLYCLVWLAIDESVYPVPRWSNAVVDTAALSALVLLIGFAYHFLGNPYRRESGIVLALAILVDAGATSLIVYSTATRRSLPFNSAFLLTVPASLFFAWTLAVFIRKWFRAASAREAHAHRAFALVFIPPMCGELVYLLHDAGVLPEVTAQLISTLLLLTMLFGFALAYINNAPQATTFQVKIVGLSLFTILAVLTVVSTVFIPHSAGITLPAGQALRLIPEDSSRYRADSIPAHFDPVPGNRLEMSHGTEAVALTWPLRFYGREWREMGVRRFPAVYFGSRPIRLFPSPGGLEGPFIAPMIETGSSQSTINADVRPGVGGVYVKQGPQSITVTWQTPKISVQLVLHRDGAIDFVYDRTGLQPFNGKRGIFPGGRIPISRNFGTPLVLQQPGPVLFEDFGLSQRLIAHPGVVKSIYCILGSTLFVLLVFPVFFRFSLVNPLSALLVGVDRIDAGGREGEVPVTFNDEIGKLTGNFNRMTRSLKTAEDELKAYAESLEVKVQERTVQLFQKNQENERLLLNILPAAIAERLKRGEGTIADAFGEATILFADIVGFTELSSRVSASELVELLNGLVSEFDVLAQRYGVEKIKTIGDAYMAVAGLPEPRADHAEAVVRLAIGMQEAVVRRSADGRRPLQLRIGINSGPVIAGVIGTHKFAYDLWGDTVNIAARMESHGKPGRIQVSESTFALMGGNCEFEARQEIQVKGKGAMATYLVVPPEEALAPAVALG